MDRLVTRLRIPHRAGIATTHGAALRGWSLRACTGQALARVGWISALSLATLTLPSSYAASAGSIGEGTARACAPVVFAPQSGELADDIRATGVGCREARRIAAFSRSYPITHKGALHRYSYAGFRCIGRDVQPIAIEFVAFRCMRGHQIVVFSRGGGRYFSRTLGSALS